MTNPRDSLDAYSYLNNPLGQQPTNLSFDHLEQAYKVISGKDSCRHTISTRQNVVKFTTEIMHEDDNGDLRVIEIYSSVKLDYILNHIHKNLSNIFHMAFPDDRRSYKVTVIKPIKVNPFIQNNKKTSSDFLPLDTDVLTVNIYRNSQSGPRPDKIIVDDVVGESITPEAAIKLLSDRGINIEQAAKQAG